MRANFKGCVNHSPARDHHLHTLTDVLDRRSFVHRYFRMRVQAAAGRFLHIPTGKAQQRPELGGSVAGNAAPGGISITGTDRAFTASALSAQGAPRAILTAECPRVAYPQGGARPTSALLTGWPAPCTSTATSLPPLLLLLVLTPRSRPTTPLVK